MKTWNKLITLITLIVLFNLDIYCQDYWLNVYDFSSGENSSQFLADAKVSEDTLYAIIRSVRFDSISGDFNRFSSLIKMDAYGNLLKQKDYSTLAPDYRCCGVLQIYGDEIIVVDNLNDYLDDSIRLSIFNKSLDLISDHTYKIADSVEVTVASSIVEFGNHYVVSGWSLIPDKPIEDYLLWIHRENMLIDTILKFPSNLLEGSGELLLGGIRNLQVQNDTMYGFWKSFYGSIYHEGFIGYDQNKNPIYYYKDQIDSIGSLGFNRIGLAMRERKYYIQDFEIGTTVNPPFTLHEIVCIDKQNNIIWKNHDTPRSNIADLPEIIYLDETIDGDLLLAGSMQWAIGLKSEHIVNEDIPDSIRFYKAPYISKIDGISGETIWQYALLINNDINAINKLEDVSWIKELSDGSIVGGGSYKDFDEDYSFFSPQDTWFFRLPGNICLEENCDFESYFNLLTSAKVVPIVKNEIKFSPNPTNGIIKINSDNQNLKNCTLYITTTDGKIIDIKEKIANGNEINLTQLLSGKYVLCLFNDQSMLLLSDIIILY